MSKYDPLWKYFQEKNEDKLLLSFAEVKEVFNIPDQYRLIAQMPFGAKTAEPDEKEVISGSDRMRILE